MTAVLTLFPAEALPPGQDAGRINDELQRFVRHLLRRPAGHSPRAHPGASAVSGARHEPLEGRVTQLRPPGRYLPFLDERRRAVEVAGEWVRLSDRELALLRHLTANAGRVLSRRELLDVVWGWDSETPTRTVDVHVSRLRRKLADRASILRTVVGAGYVYG